MWQSCGYFCFWLLLDELFPPVENLTITATTTTSISLQWDVSIHQDSPWNSHFIARLLFFQGYDFPFGSRYSYGNRYELQWVTSRGYRRSTTITSYSTRYTLSRLTFGETYNISIRARTRHSSCYTNLYGDYSDVISVTIVETGNYYYSNGMYAFTISESLKAMETSNSLVAMSIMACSMIKHNDSV